MALMDADLGHAPLFAARVEGMDAVVMADYVSRYLLAAWCPSRDRQFEQ
ncbi:hypothetical protein [Acidovorax sp. Root219]|nr:hypothetical protein [Acidovorax sp. Root219]